MPQISQLMEVYPKISKTVDDRQKRITDDLAAAQAGQDKAEQIEADYRTSINEARAAAIEFVNEAKAKAASKNEAAIKRAETAIGKKADEADAELKAAQSSAMKEIEAVAAEAAQAIVKTVSGAKVTATEAKKAVKAAF